MRFIVVGLLLVASYGSTCVLCKMTCAEDAPKTSVAVWGADKAKQLGAESPEQAFEIFKNAVEKDDWKSVFQVQTERSRDFVVGGSLAACFLGFVGEDGKKLASEVTDQMKVMDLVSKSRKAPVSEQEKISQELAALVSKKRAFMSRAMAVFRKQKLENWLTFLAMNRLVELKIDGDRATAEMEIRAGTGVGSEPAGSSV